MDVNTAIVKQISDWNTADMTAAIFNLQHYGRNEIKGKKRISTRIRQSEYRHELT